MVDEPLSTTIASAGTGLVLTISSFAAPQATNDHSVTNKTATVTRRPICRLLSEPGDLRNKLILFFSNQTENTRERYRLFKVNQIALLIPSTLRQDRSRKARESAPTPEYAGNRSLHARRHAR